MKIGDTVTVAEDTGSTGRTVTGTVLNFEDTYVEIARGGLIDTVFFVDITAFSTLNKDPKVETRTIRPSKIGVPRA